MREKGQQGGLDGGVGTKTLAPRNNAEAAVKRTDEDSRE